MTEEWRPVPGYEGFYEVSSLGNLRSVTRVVDGKLGSKRTLVGKPMTQTVDDQGYRRVSLHRDRKRKSLLVHRIVLEAFIGACPLGHEALHDDDDPTNNRLENLRWGTRSANMLDRVKNGRHHNSVKTRCINDHPFDESNTYTYTYGGRRHRSCKACKAQRSVYGRALP